MKASTAASFGIDRKYERFPRLLLAYVWQVGRPADTAAYCLTYPEAVEVADWMGYTATASWREGRSPKHGLAPDCVSRWLAIS